MCGTCCARSETRSPLAKLGNECAVGTRLHLSKYLLLSRVKEKKAALGIHSCCGMFVCDRGRRDYVSASALAMTKGPCAEVGEASVMIINPRPLRSSQKKSALASAYSFTPIQSPPAIFGPCFFSCILTICTRFSLGVAGQRPEDRSVCRQEAVIWTSSPSKDCTSTCVSRLSITF